MPRPGCLVVQLEGTDLLVVAGNGADLLLTAAAGEHIVVPVVIVHDAGFPQRVKLFRIGANLHLDAGHTVRIFAVCQVAPASIAVTLHALCCARLPRHGRYHHSGRGINGSVDQQIQRRIFRIVHCHIGNAGNLSPRKDIVVVCHIAVIVGICAALAKAYSGADKEICTLCLCHQHALYAGFCRRQCVLIIIVSATLQLAAVAHRPMPDD